MIKTYIVAESGADLLKSDVENNDIRIVPMHVTFDDACLDDGSFPVCKIFEYYNRTKQLPKTSATNPYEYRNIFEEILTETPDAHILHLGYSAVTTASFHNALLAAEDYDNIIHIDTRNVSAGQRAIVMKMAQFIKENPSATPHQLQETAEKLIDKCRFCFFPGNLEYLKAGGRVSNAAYLAASVLGIKPLIEIVDGKLVGAKKYRGSNEKVFVKFLEEYLAATKLEKDSFFMVYSEGLPAKTKAELEKVAAHFGYKDFVWVPTGCVISTHAGPGAFGVGGFIE